MGKKRTNSWKPPRKKRKKKENEIKNFQTKKGGLVRMAKRRGTTNTGQSRTGAVCCASFDCWEKFSSACRSRSTIKFKRKQPGSFSSNTSVPCDNSFQLNNSTVCVKKIQSFNRYIQLLNSKNHNSSATYRRKEFHFKLNRFRIM